MKSLIAFVGALLVAGSAAQTLTATPTGISIEYDRNFTDHLAVVSQANEHCAQYGKVASLTDTTIFTERQLVHPDFPLRVASTSAFHHAPFTSRIICVSSANRLAFPAINSRYLLMTTADWAIFISLGSLVVALFSLIWNFWSKFIYPKPRVRVGIGIMTLMPNPNNVPSFVSMNATNYGPTDVTLYLAIARKRRPWFRRHGPIAVLNPLEGFPDRRDHSVGPFSAGLPKKLAVGEQFSVYFLVVKDWVEKENLVRFGFSDTFGRYHWCTRRSGEEFRKKVSDAA